MARQDRERGRELLAVADLRLQEELLEIVARGRFIEQLDAVVEGAQAFLDGDQGVDVGLGALGPGGGQLLHRGGKLRDR